MMTDVTLQKNVLLTKWTPI